MAQEAAGKGRNPQIELKCVVDSSMLGPLRTFVCSVARELGFTDAQVGEIEICVDEACANALEHAYDTGFEREFPNAERDLCLEMQFQGDELTVRIIDHGCGGGEEGIHPRIRKIEDYLERDREKYRGLGLYLIHQLMDRVDVRSAPGRGTTVEMTKFRR